MGPVKMKIALVCVLFFFAKWAMAQNYAKQTDSLEQTLPSLAPKQQIKTYIDMCWSARHYDPPKSLAFGWKAVSLARQFKEKEMEADALNRLGVCYRGSGEGVKAVQVLDTAVRVAQEAGSLVQLAYAYNNIGGVYGFLIQNDPLLLENAHKALTIFSKLKNTNGILDALRYISIAHNNSKNYDSALVYSEKAAELGRTQKNWQGYARTLVFMAVIYRNLKQDSLAQIYFGKAIHINQNYQAATNSYIWKEYIGHLFSHKKYDSVVYYLDYVRKNNKISPNDALWFNNYSADLALARKDSIKATGHLLIIRQLLDSLNKSDKQKLLANHGLVEKQKEVEVHRLELERQDQIKYIYWLSLIILLLVALLLGFNFWKGKRFNQILLLKNEEIHQKKEEIQYTLGILSEQKEIIEGKNKDIIASINYAKRIQNAIMPLESRLKEAFPQSFILYKPKDIVSGDFFWFSTQADIVFLAAADCTGHGVSGAFMTLIGTSLLNQIVNENFIFSPDQILSELDKRLLQTLQQSTESRQINDGMDISLMAWDKKRAKILFSSAKRPIFYVKDRHLHEIKGSRFPIGGAQKKFEKKFDLHQIDSPKVWQDSKNEPSFEIPTALTVYLFTDGFADQFGGENNKKLLIKNFKNFIQEIQNQDFETHQSLLDTYFETWKGTNKQLDDVLVLGVRIG
jgi:serine phosphatase RsbU (regulator of sigma subunit)